MIVLLAGAAAWSYRDRLAPPPATQSAGRAVPPGNVKVMSTQRLSNDEFQRQLQENVPLRVKLAKQYPDSYDRLAQQTRKNLRDCIVTEVVPGVLKAVCQ